MATRICSIPDCGRPYQAGGLCHKHYMQKYYADHPEQREKSRLKMQGVDGAWYAAQLLKQNGVCAICHKPENKTMKGTLMRLAVDHCHDTGTVRGLLCQACNRGIGCFNHDPVVLASSIEYLKQPM